MATDKSIYRYGAIAAGVSILMTAVLATYRGVPMGLPLDDAWIHAAFARHLAGQGIWGLFAGQPSGGESSLLWPLLLSVGELGDAGRAPSLALILGALCFVALPGLAGQLATGPKPGRVVAVAIGLSGPLLFTALSGMETMPALTCGVAALVFLGKGRVGRAAWLAGLAVLLRPDSALLIPILMIGLWLRRDDFARSLIRLWPALLLAAVAVIGLSLLEGRFPPATLAGRRWLGGLPLQPDAASFIPGCWHLIRTWTASLTADYGAGRLTEDWSGGRLWLALWRVCAVFAVTAGGVALARARTNPQARPLLLLLIWTAVVLAFYGLVLPDRGQAGRYQPQIYLAVTVLAVEGIFLIWSFGRRITRAAATCALLLSAGLLAHCGEAAYLWGDAVRQITTLHLATAGELTEELGPDTVIGVFDVGAVAYVHRGALVDLSGLSSREVAASLQDRELERYLIEQKVTHLVLPVFSRPEGPGCLRDRLGLLEPLRLQLAPVATYSIPNRIWDRQFRFTGSAFRYLTLYRVDIP